MTQNTRQVSEKQMKRNPRWFGARKVKVAMFFAVAGCLVYSAIAWCIWKGALEVQYCIAIRSNLRETRKNTGSWPTSLPDPKSLPPSLQWLSKVENDSKPELVILRCDKQNLVGKLKFHWFMGGIWDIDIIAD